MLKFLFNRFSKVVYLMECLGVLFTLGWFWKGVSTPLFWICVAEYVFIRFCATKRWYKKSHGGCRGELSVGAPPDFSERPRLGGARAKRYEGIELHFKKAMISTSYILAITSGIGYFTGITFPLWIAIFLLAVLGHVNLILLYLNYRDKNKTPVNYYSNEKYLAVSGQHSAISQKQERSAES